MAEATTWLRVTLPYATFILAATDGKVTRAPGAEKMEGCATRDVAAFFRRRGVSVEPLDDVAVFIKVACDAYDDETAARLIEERCHPPLPERLARGPRYAQEQQGGAA